MAVPFRRTSKTRKRMRRSHQALTIGTLITCKNCGAAIKPHHVCPNCGFYDGKVVPNAVKTTNKGAK